MVVITSFTTIYPTDLAQATSVSPAPSTTAVSFSTSQSSSSSPGATFSISSMVVPSQTVPPTSSVTGVPLASKPKFDDSFVFVILAVVILFAVLLIAMVSYMMYLRYKGQCPQCRGLKQQLSKWESGELTRITPLMVAKRETRNKAAVSSNASSEIDIEKGDVGRRMSRAPTLDQLEINKKPSLFQKMKAHIARRRKSPTQTLASPANSDLDLFFTVNRGATANGPGPSHSIASRTPQAGYDADYLHANRYSSYPASSVYHQPTEYSKRSRVFTNVSTSDSPNNRGPLRKESEEPNSYTAYATTEHDENDSRQKDHVAIALARLESREYKEANAVLNRQSASDSEVQRALEVVNFGDLQLNIARRPRLFSQVPVPLHQPPEEDVPAEPGEYEMFSWRKKGRRPPDLGEL